MKINKNQGNMSVIHFNAKLFRIGSWTLILLPNSVSAKLPSRGMTMVKGTINGFRFQAVLEPDGKGSHWFKVTEMMRKAAKADVGDNVDIVIKPTKEWPEPTVPDDLKKAVEADEGFSAFYINSQVKSNPI